MVGTPSTKKRKRADVDDVEGRVVLTLSDPEPSQCGPVLANFPALHPPKSTPFQCYLRPSSSKDTALDQPFSSQPILLAGETKTVEFYSTNETESSNLGCSYLIAVHDKKTHKVSFRPASLQLLTRQVKALKQFETAPVLPPTGNQAWNTLGVTFGSKTTVRAIHAAERNKLDVSALKGVTSHLQDRIDSNTTALPSKEEAKATADSNRLIPKYNINATSPGDVYALHDIIPEAEYDAIPISEMLSAASSKECNSLLPHKYCNWIKNHLNLAFACPKPNRSTLKIIYYISAMLAFKQASFRLHDKETFYERMKPAPTVIVDGLLTRFTEVARNTSKAQMTQQTETALFTHMFALCLRIDDFATDTSLLAQDLSMAVEKVNKLFKSLGCKMATLTLPEMQRLGLPSTAAATKRAVLKVPLQFPDAKSFKKRR